MARKPPWVVAAPQVRVGGCHAATLSEELEELMYQKNDYFLESMNALEETHEHHELYARQ